MPEPEDLPASTAVPSGLLHHEDHGEVTALVPAATVMVLRDGDEGLEVLMLRRNSSLAFAGGMWVFPGGRLDPADRVGPAGTELDGTELEGTETDPEDPDVLLAAARRAAVREAREEAGIDLDADALVWFSHWTPPERPGRRFATWFFVTLAPPRAAGTGSGVTIDGGEIIEHAWMRPGDAHRRRDAMDIELSPPTWISLWQLLPYDGAADAVAGLAAGDIEHFATRIVVRDRDVFAIYAGDAAYEDDDVDRAGGRHRLHMAPDGWTYVRPDQPVGSP